jgi:hypothetical protein
MSLVSDIKQTAQGKGLSVANAKVQKIEGILNQAFYASKNPEEELKFLKRMLTKGAHNEERVGLHASALIAGEAEYCARQQLLSLYYKMEQGENVPIGLKRIFEEGNAIHEKWQRLFIRAGLGTAKDMDFTQYDDRFGFTISFTPDAILGIEDESMVTEIKSVNTYQFSKLTNHASGEKQAHFYMYETGIHKGLVLCDDKNNQDFKVFLLDYNRDIVAPFVERLDALKYSRKRLVRDGKMIARRNDCNSYTCKKALKCPMRDACYNRGKGRVLIEA